LDLFLLLRHYRLRSDIDGCPSTKMVLPRATGKPSALKDNHESANTIAAWIGPPADGSDHVMHIVEHLGCIHYRLKSEGEN
jgi:hypothetical protein